MVSETKVLANRRNAQRSTGPRTEDGKRIASKNAVTHGLLSREVLLPDEDATVFNALQEELITELDPVGPLESMWVDIIVATQWKWRRLHRIEHGIFVYHQNESRTAALPHLLRMLTPGEELALVMTRDAAHGDQLGKVARYEAMLERRLTHALHELERLQAARQGMDVAPPVAVDVTVAVPEVVEVPTGTGTPTLVPTNDAGTAAPGARTEPASPDPAVIQHVDALPVDTSAWAGRGENAAPLPNEPNPNDEEDVS